MTTTQKLKEENERLNKELGQLREERNYYRDELDKKIGEQVKQKAQELYADSRSRLIQEIRWIIGIIVFAFAITTMGGYFAISEIINSLIDKKVKTVIEQREKSFEDLRQNAVKALAQNELTIQELKIRTNSLLASLQSLKDDYASLSKQEQQIRQQFKLVKQSSPARLANQIKQLNSLTRESDAIIAVSEKLDSLYNNMTNLSGQVSNIENRKIVNESGLTEELPDLFITTRARDRELIEVPNGGNISDWNIVVIPRGIGYYNDKTDRSKRIINFNCFAVVSEKKDGWRIRSTFEYIDENTGELKSGTGTATVLLYPKALALSY
jgi:predicted RNase H-like nuclease (RuvC/YqgF family)